VLVECLERIDQQLVRLQAGASRHADDPQVIVVER